jgi:carbon-monoxide dehydrogenase large subunit
MSSYQVPSAAELPSFVTDHVITPSTSNPGGWKGVGEAGTIGSPPAVVNAVIDALSPLGSPTSACRRLRSGSGGPSMPRSRREAKADLGAVR